MRLLAEDPEALTRYTYEDLIKLGGTESVEVVNWLAMRGALAADAKPSSQAYYAHRIMGYGLQTFEVRMSDIIDRILDGAVDLHVHPVPLAVPAQDGRRRGRAAGG